MVDMSARENTKMATFQAPEKQTSKGLTERLWTKKYGQTNLFTVEKYDLLNHMKGFFDVDTAEIINDPLSGGREKVCLSCG